MNAPRTLSLETVARIQRRFAAGCPAAEIARHLRMPLAEVDQALSQDLDESQLAWQREPRRMGRPPSNILRTKPIKPAVCPGCRGTITEVPCVLCAARGVTYPQPPRPLPASWRQCPVNCGAALFVNWAELEAGGLTLA